MKKLLFSIAAAAAMLVSCSEKEITVPETGSGEPFSFHASILADNAQDTKTTLTIAGTADEPQYKVAWDEGDRLSVVAVYADESRKAYQFTKGDGDIFSCESVENPGDIKALNVFYPYDKNQYDMDGEYGRAGMSFGMNAVQNGTDDAAHIDGPLYGYAQVADGQASVAMAHASALFDIQVVNNGDSDISVSKISVTAGEETYLMGWFQINPQTGELKLGTAKYYISELNVTDGTVGAGQTGHFYITAAPFSMTAGSQLTVTVTASGEDYIVKKNMERDVTFAAGKVNHVTNIAVSPVASVSVIPEYIAPSFVSGSFDNGDISVGGGAYKFADIQINYNAGDKFYDNKTSSVTFGEIGDSVVYSTEAPNGGNIVNGLGEGIRFVNTNEAGYYYNAPSDWDYLMSFDAKNEL